MKEEWRPVVGYEGIYEVSNTGKVRSCDRIDASGFHRKGRMMKLNFGINGYVRANIWSPKEKRQRTLEVHRLVAEAFIPNPNKLPQVNHIDENKANNNVGNLEWVTMKQNNMHGTRLARQGITYKALPEEKKKHPHKIVLELDDLGNVLHEFYSVREAAQHFGIDESGISKCCRGLLKTSGGRYWRYKN